MANVFHSVSINLNNGAGLTKVGRLELSFLDLTYAIVVFSTGRWKKNTLHDVTKKQVFSGTLTLQYENLFRQ